MLSFNFVRRLLTSVVPGVRAGAQSFSAKREIMRLLRQPIMFAIGILSFSVALSLAISLLGKSAGGEALIANRDLSPGEQLDPDRDFHHFQGGNHPLARADVRGAILKRRVKQGQMLRPADIGQ